MCSDGSGDPVAALEAALDEVAGADLKGLCGSQVLELSRRLLTAKNRLDAQLARAVREGEVLSHTKVHHGFRISRQPNGRWRTYRPDGTEIVMPEPLSAA